MTRPKAHIYLTQALTKAFTEAGPGHVVLMSNDPEGNEITPFGDIEVALYDPASGETYGPDDPDAPPKCLPAVILYPADPR